MLECIVFIYTTTAGFLIIQIMNSTDVLVMLHAIYLTGAQKNNIEASLL